MLIPLRLAAHKTHSCHLKPVDLNPAESNLPHVTERRVQSAFGKALRKYRQAAELSQEALAASARLNRTYVGDIERGERNVSIVNMHKLAKALGVNLSELIHEMECQLRARSHESR